MVSHQLSGKSKRDKQTDKVLLIQRMGSTKFTSNNKIYNSLCCKFYMAN